MIWNDNLAQKSGATLANRGDGNTTPECDKIYLPSEMTVAGLSYRQVTETS